MGIYNALTDEQAVAAIEAVVNELPPIARSISTLTIAKRSVNNTTVTRVIDFKPKMIPLLMALPESNRYYKPISLSRHLTQEVVDQIYSYIYHHPIYGSDSKRPLPKTFIKILANLIINPATSATKRLEMSEYLTARYEGAPYVDATVSYLAGSVAGFISSRKRKLPELGTSWGGYIDHDPNTFGTISAEVAEAVNYMEPHNYPSLTPKLKRLGYLTDSFDDSIQDPPELTSYEITERIDPYLDPRGPHAWRVFLHLLPEWQGSLDELLTTSTGSTAP